MRCRRDGKCFLKSVSGTVSGGFYGLEHLDVSSMIVPKIHVLPATQILSPVFHGFFI
jgi:hypothetical protein